jgi:hypothetical protein
MSFECLGLLINSFTSVPLSPRRFLTTSEFVKPMPATLSVSTFTIRSPERIPARSEGPPENRAYHYNGIVLNLKLYAYAFKITLHAFGNTL